MNCNKCGNAMTPTVLFTSTVYDCSACTTPRSDLRLFKKAYALAEYYGVTPERLEKALSKANARSEQSERWLTKAEALASGPGPYEQGFSNGEVNIVEFIPRTWLDKTEEDDFSEVVCLGWRRKQ